MLALMGSAIAQDIEFCTSSSQCDTAKYGERTCCSRLTYLSFSDTNNLGQFTDNVLGGEDNLVPGNHNTEICIYEEFRDALEEEVEAQGYLTYYDDIRLFRETDEGLLAAFDSPEEWIEAWGADLDSMYKFIGKRECMEDIDPSNLARLNSLKNTRSKLHTLEQEVAFEMDFVLANL